MSDINQKYYKMDYIPPSIERNDLKRIGLWVFSVYVPFFEDYKGNKTSHTIIANDPNRALNIIKELEAEGYKPSPI